MSLLHYPNAVCLSLSLIFVLPLYVMVPKEVKNLEYNDSVQIKYRMYAVSAATIFAVLLCWTLYYDLDLALGAPKFQVMIGLNENLLSGMITSLFLMMIFYFGPIVLYLTLNFIKLSHRISDKGQLSRLPYPMPVWEFVTNIYLDVTYQIRSFDIKEFRAIVFAPVAEEIVFRACMVPPYYIYYKYILKDYSPYYIIYVAPSWFGVAHIHHLITKLKSGEKWMVAVAQTLFQFIYTIIFGCLASMLFLRTGSILSPIVSHMFCNYMGLPSNDYLVRGKSKVSCVYPYRYLFLGLDMLGLCLFVYAVIPFTESFQDHNIYWE